MWFGTGAGVRALGGAVAGGISATIQGKDADKVAVQALVNGVISAANPGAFLLGNASKGAIILGGTLNSTGSNVLTGALSSGRVDPASAIGAAGGRALFGFATGGIGGPALQDLGSRLTFDIGSGVSAGLVGGTVRSAEQSW